MNLKRIATLVVSLVVLAVPAATLYAAGPPQVERGHDRDAIVAYWTPERIASATPRDIVRDGGPAAPKAKPSGTPGKGGGGGGEDDGDTATSTNVTGESWPEHGDIQKQTGRVLFSFGSSNYVCSGSVVSDGDGATENGHALILTAGHCVYDDIDDVFADNFAFIPDYDNGGSFTNGTGPYGVWTASRLVTTSAWATRDFEDDYAFAVVTDTINGLTLDQTVGELNIAFATNSPGADVHAFGYPSEGKFKGNDLIYCAGSNVDDPAGSTTNGIECKMNGGSSGGPWIEDFDPVAGSGGTVTSLTSYSYRSLKGYLFGPEFDSYTERTFNAANTGGGSNTLVN